MPDGKDAGSPGDLIELGRIVSAYGVLGWVKIQPYSVQSEALLKAKTWWLKAPVSVLGNAGASSFAQAARVLACRPQGAALVAQLDVVTDRDQAEGMKGHTIWASRADFPQADPDEYYWVDLIGCRVFGDDHGQSALIGEVLDVIDNGAHAVLRVARATIDPQGALIPHMNDKGRPVEVLVPFVEAHVQSVDIVNKRLESNWPVEF